MSEILIDATVYNFAKSKSKKVKAAVELGTGLIVIPRSLAEELEVQVISRDEIKVTGQTVTIERGVIVLEAEGRKTTC